MIEEGGVVNELQLTDNSWDHFNKVKGNQKVCGPVLYGDDTVQIRNWLKCVQDIEATFWRKSNCYSFVGSVGCGQVTGFYLFLLCAV